MTARSWVRLALSLLLFLGFLVHTSGLHRFRLLTQIEALTYDARVLLTLPGTPDPAVVILDVDEKSIAAEGWPWPRSKWAALVRSLFDHYQVKVLGFDIGFAEPDRSSGAELLERLEKQDLADLPGFAARVAPIKAGLDYDGQFGEAIRGKPIVLGYFHKSMVPKGEPPETGALCPPLMDADAAKLYVVNFHVAEGYGGNVAALQSATPHCGFFDNPTVDEDGVYRRVPLMQSFKGAVYPSLALAITQLALGNPPVQLEFDPPDRHTSLNLERVRLGNVLVPVDGDVAAYVPYRGPYHTITYVSAADALHGTADPAVLKSAIVIVGTSAAGLLDLRTTPVGRAYAGVEVHANLVSGMLGDRVRQKAPYYSGIEATLLAIIAVLIALVFPRLSPLAGAGLGVGTIAVVIGLAMAMWSGAKFIMPMGVPILFTLTVFMAHLLYGYFIESRGKREISKLFGQYVPPELVEEMAANPESISMEGENREMTVLFSDVRDFTSISEKLAPKELSALMNLYLTRMTGEIQKQRGTIDKYIGDAIMAFWGAPLPDPTHAVRGLEAGMALVAAVRALDAEFVKRGWPPLHIGVGVNTGKMSVGNMGSEFRMAYTVMGDAVNLGSRVEGLTKEYGVAILCTEFTRGAAPSEWSFREVDLVRVKGRKEPVAIYEPLGPKDALDPALRQDLARHRGAMKLYRQQAWDQAEVEFFNLNRAGRPHPIYDLFLKRIAYLRQHPPGADWDGAFTFTTK